MSKGIAINRRAIPVTDTVIRDVIPAVKILKVFFSMSTAPFCRSPALCIMRGVFEKRPCNKRNVCLHLQSTCVERVEVKWQSVHAVAPASQFHSLSLSPDLFSSLFRLRNPPSRLAFAFIDLWRCTLPSRFGTTFPFLPGSGVRLPHHVSGGKRINCICRPKDGHVAILAVLRRLFDTSA